MPYKAVVDLLLERRVSGAPVVDAAGTVLGGSTRRPSWSPSLRALAAAWTSSTG
jgi:hypothetical protein